MFIAVSIFLLAQHLTIGQLQVCDTDSSEVDALTRSFVRLGAANLTAAPQIRDRESFPDSQLKTLPEYLAGPSGQEFPAVYRYNRDDSKSLVQIGRDLGLFADKFLPQYGVLVIKGLPLTEPVEVSTLLHASNMTLIDYVGGVTSREVVAPKVTPASGEREDVSMESHNDNPYWPSPPTRLVLWAKTPPRSGGQALITDGRAVLRDIDPQVVEELRKRKVQYQHFWPDEHSFQGVTTSSWQLAFKPQIDAACAKGNCNATRAVEAFLVNGGYSFKWLENGLQRWEISDAIKRHPVTGEETWCNMITAMHCTVFDNHPVYPDLRREPNERGEFCDFKGEMPYHTKFGDGSQFPVSFIHEMRRAQWTNSVAFDYQSGDVILIDNYLAMHGRFSFEPPRELFLTMVGLSHA